MKQRTTIWKIKSNEIYNSSIEELLSYCSKKKELSLDTETTGLDPHTSKIVLIQIGDINQSFIIDVRFTPKYNILKLKSILEDDSIVKIGQNLIFDYKMLLSNFGIRISNLKDCMIQNMAINLNKKNVKHSLEAMCKQYLGITFGDDLFGIYPKKSTRLQFLNIGKEPLTKEQIMYAANDIIYPILINKKQEKIIKEYKLKNCITLENDYIQVLGEMEYNGFYLDPIAWVKVYMENKIKEEEKLQQLKSVSDINWRSPKQVSKVFRDLGIPVDIKVNDKTKTTVNEVHIKQFEHQFPIIKEYLEYQEFKKSTTTYGEKFLKYINRKTGRIHSSFIQMVKTGRIASSDPNLQNIPRLLRFRECFKAQPGMDTTLIVADYSGQELRILADKANEPKMIDTFLHGDGDLHSLTAKLIFDKSQVTKEERLIGKVTNFLISYGGGPSKLSKQFGLSMKKASELISKYFKAYTKLKEYFDIKARTTESTGYVLIDPITNRRTWHSYHKTFEFCKEFKDKWNRHNWKVPKEIESAYSMSKSKIRRDSQNFPIQGTGASMVKLAGIMLYKWQKESKMFDKFKIVLCVHDEIILEVKNQYAQLVSDKLRECMIKSGKIFVEKVPMEVSILTTPIWNH